MRASLPVFCSFELQVASCPFFGDSSGLFFDCWRWDFDIRRKWQSQKFQNALRSGAMRRDNVFIKKDQRLNLILAKIIFPSFIVRRDAIAPFVDYLEIELGYGLRLRFLLGFLSPNTCLACHGPGDCLLDMVPAPHPYVFWLAENSREKLRSIQSLVCRDFLQHLEHSFEITPHYDSAENSIGCRIFPQNVLHIRDARWCAPAFFPGFFGLGQKILPWRSGYASASEDAAKQMCSAALNGSNDVRNCRVQKFGERTAYLPAIGEAPG